MMISELLQFRENDRMNLKAGLKLLEKCKLSMNTIKLGRRRVANILHPQFMGDIHFALISPQKFMHPIIVILSQRHRPNLWQQI